jgi:ketosteroid isomerase-like protein
MSDIELPTDPKQLVRYTFEEGIDERNKEVVMGAFADEVEVLQDSFENTMTPERAWQGLMAEVQAFPDYTHDIQNVFEDDDTVIVTYHASGTFKNDMVLGENAVFEPTGEEMQISGVAIARVEDGEITGFASYSERLQLFQQTGIVPPLAELAD